MDAQYCICVFVVEEYIHPEMERYNLKQGDRIDLISTETNPTGLVYSSVAKP